MAELKMAKRRAACEDCKAFEAAHSKHCVLGYPITGRYDKNFGITIHYPDAPCPRPTTTKDYITTLESPDTWAYKGK